MLKLDEERLKGLLEKNRTKIGFQKISILPVVISFLSSLITFLCKDDYPFLFVKILMIVVVTSSFLYTIYVVVSSTTNNYNYESLYYDIETLDNDKAHFFNIVIQRYSDKSGKFLTFYSDPRKCKLFPNYKSIFKYKDSDTPTTEELANIRKLYQKDTGIAVLESDMQYKGLIHDFKYSPNDKINKHYIFRFFLIDKDPADNISDVEFEYAGRKYYWMTISDMLKDKRIVKNNKKVVDYVKSFTTLS